MENKNFIYEGTTFSDMVLEKVKIVGIIVSVGTLFSALLIKANNILFAGVKGTTIVPYYVSFIIFLLLLTLGSIVLVKYSMDAYPFYKKTEEEYSETTLASTSFPKPVMDSNASTTLITGIAPDMGVSAGIAGEAFAVNSIVNNSNNGLFTPLETINNVIVSENKNIILDNISANAELERQVDYYNVQESMEEIVDSDACDMLWESNDDETFII